MTNSSIDETIERTEDAIDSTRERVRERLDRLQEDFSPKALLDQIVPEGQPLSETVRQVTDAAKRNPFATALLAGGVALLGKDLLGDSAARAGNRAVRRGKRVAHDVSGRVQASASNLADDGREIAAKSRTAVTKAASRIKHEASDAFDHAAQTGHDVYDAGSEYARTGKRWVEENPVAAGLAAAAAGALIASYFAAKPVSKGGSSRTDDHDDDMPPARTRPTRKAAATKRKPAKTTRKKVAAKPSKPRKTSAASKPRRASARTVKPAASTANGVDRSSSATTSSLN